MAKIVFAVDHMNFGDESDRTGWYWMRITVGCNSAGKPTSIIDRKPIAKLLGSSTDQQMEIITLDETLRSGAFQMMPPDWMLKDVH